MKRGSGLVCGFGINNSTVPVTKWVDGKCVNSVSYRTWMNMINRCYNENFKNKHPTYEECSISDEWKYYLTFKEWFDRNYKEGYHLDKDLLVGGNKEYSPYNCLFIPQIVNKSIVVRSRSKNGNPIGVTFAKSRGKFQAQCGTKGKRSNFGFFKTPFEAHCAWRVAKIKSLDELKDTQEEWMIKIGLQRVIDKLQSDQENHIETLDFN